VNKGGKFRGYSFGVDLKVFKIKILMNLLTTYFEEFFPIFLGFVERTLSSNIQRIR